MHSSSSEFKGLLEDFRLIAKHFGLWLVFGALLAVPLLLISLFVRDWNASLDKTVALFFGLAWAALTSLVLYGALFFQGDVRVDIGGLSMHFQGRRHRGDHAR